MMYGMIEEQLNDIDNKIFEIQLMGAEVVYLKLMVGNKFERKY